MKIIYTDSYQQMSQQAYELLKETINASAAPVINTTTGASYDGMFALLVEGVNRGEVAIEKAFFMNLDEYVAPRERPFTIYSYMYQKLYDQLQRQPARIELLDGSQPPFDEEIRRYAQVLADFPRDLQILGLGVNGHLGANEPGTAKSSRLFVADSVESTIQSTMQYHHLTREQTPTQMITLGLADILDARKILVTASGVRKAAAVKAMVEGPVNADCPASFLQEHPDVTLIVDRDAASLLSTSA